MSYGHFQTYEGEEHGSFEVFYADESDCEQYTETWTEEGNCSEDEESPYTPGWYWWACFPGCMPDSDPNGPYESEDAAEESAKEEY